MTNERRAKIEQALKKAVDGIPCPLCCGAAIKPGDPPV